MATPTIVTWRGLTIAGDGSTLLKLNGLSGWRGELPPARFQSDERLGAHGEFDTPVYAGARTVILTGEARTNAQRDALFSSYALAVAYGATSETLQVQEAGLTLTAKARLIQAAPSRVAGEWGMGRFGFAVQWRCADPLLYAPTLTDTCGVVTTGGGLLFPWFGGGMLNFGTVPAPQVADFTNTGSGDSPILLTVNAGGTAWVGGFTIVESQTGNVLTYVDDLPAGSFVTLDSATGLVMLNGTADRRTSLAVAQWTQAAAGAYRSFTIQGLTTTSATAQLTAAMAPVYW